MEYSDRDVILVGAGGHARVIIDILINCHPELRLAGILDKDPSKHGTMLEGLKILGDDTLLQKLYNKGIRKALVTKGTIGNFKPRQYIYKAVKEIGFELINAIHCSCYISSKAVIGEGNVFMPNAVVNAGAVIGDNCIINTGSIIEHDCTIGDGTHVATGAKIAGDVQVGKNCLIGIGASVIQGIKIGDNSTIGAGSVVIEDIPEGSIAVGVPARVIKRRKEL